MTIIRNTSSAIVANRQPTWDIHSQYKLPFIMDLFQASYKP